MNDEQNFKVVAKIKPQDESNRICEVQLQPIDSQEIKITQIHSESRDDFDSRIQKYGGPSSLKKNHKDKVQKFHKVFVQDSEQKGLSNEVSTYIESVIDGYNATVLAYGPAFSGKSQTMSGIIQQGVEVLFQTIDQAAQANPTHIYEVEMSYVELNHYGFHNLISDEVVTVNAEDASTIGGKSFGTMELAGGSIVINNREKIDIRETPLLGVFLAGPNIRLPVKSLEEAFEYIDKGNKARNVMMVNDKPTYR